MLKRQDKTHKANIFSFFPGGGGGAHLKSITYVKVFFKIKTPIIFKKFSPFFRGGGSQSSPEAMVTVCI